MTPEEILKSNGFTDEHFRAMGEAAGNDGRHSKYCTIRAMIEYAAIQTLRSEIAARAMQGILSNQYSLGNGINPAEIARMAVEHADTLIKTLNEK